MTEAGMLHERNKIQKVILSNKQSVKEGQQLLP